MKIHVDKVASVTLHAKVPREFDHVDQVEPELGRVLVVRALREKTVYDKVERHEQVTVRALDRAGATFELACEGLAAVCVQHEMDHLMGRVFVEYLSPLKRDRIRTKMLKRARDAQRD